ncbi:hypothetical protein BC938DRAFT_480836 [Jimgerdemannia flammicorona]|uniref:Response regulatory domain-containing protein n=1 Tax=Jimgerdemannia flammicorona TaxID=994334 RepID=A0A433QHK7_9FUNG|nr:hypothetical protein BC938DRAFT_480836 [Jimgerdemannia flammicorona]
MAGAFDDVISKPVTSQEISQRLKQFCNISHATNTSGSSGSIASSPVFAAGGGQDAMIGVEDQRRNNASCIILFGHGNEILSNCCDSGQFVITQLEPWPASLPVILYLLSTNVHRQAEMISNLPSFHKSSLKELPPKITMQSPSIIV